MNTTVQKYEDWIKNNFNDIVAQTNLEILLQYVKRKKIFPDILLVQYQLSVRTSFERKRQFYLDIVKRKLPLTSKSYQLLMEVCQESCQYTLYLILKAEPSILANNPRIIEDVAASLNIHKLKIVVKTSKKLMDISSDKENVFPPYPMHGPKRGVALVINNIKFENNMHEKRNGADVDAKNLEELFIQMGFIWIYWENKTKQQLQNKLSQFTNESNKTLSEVDCCFVIVMSYGGQNSSIREDTHFITHDNKEFKASHFINSFTNSSCKLLQGKPKVIIFQACRGNLKDFGTKIIHSENNTNIKTNTIETDNSTMSNKVLANTNIPNWSDMFICYTTSPGYKSFRDKYKGAWFIQYFCEIFMNYAYNTDVTRLFGMIADKVTEERTIDNALQCPYYMFSKFRLCFLNPLPISKINEIHK